jgi:hypothetical protein
MTLFFVVGRIPLRSGTTLPLSAGYSNRAEEDENWN